MVWVRVWVVSLSGDIFRKFWYRNVTFRNVEMSHLYGTTMVTLNVVMSHFKYDINIANVTFNVDVTFTSSMSHFECDI